MIKSIHFSFLLTIFVERLDNVFFLFSLYVLLNCYLSSHALGRPRRTPSLHTSAASCRKLDSGRVTESGKGIDHIEEDSQILILEVPFGDRRPVNHRGSCGLTATIPLLVNTQDIPQKNRCGGVYGRLG